MVRQNDDRAVGGGLDMRRPGRRRRRPVLLWPGGRRDSDLLGGWDWERSQPSLTSGTCSASRWIWKKSTRQTASSEAYRA